MRSDPSPRYVNQASRPGAAAGGSHDGTKLDRGALLVGQETSASINVKKEAANAGIQSFFAHPEPTLTPRGDRGRKASVSAALTCFVQQSLQHIYTYTSFAGWRALCTHLPQSPVSELARQLLTGWPMTVLCIRTWVWRTGSRASWFVDAVHKPRHDPMRRARVARDYRAAAGSGSPKAQGVPACVTKCSDTILRTTCPAMGIRSTPPRHRNGGLLC
ncbi:hypothetical protein BT67DRAFT_189389 [Trichocladium antarcticum]|uniref:Uncharacterized protein n=1 Tax=Trichocladium antarcticum TaxID=1450529 RepID=A0AAN6UPD9_9PEZI|nr:hypothetical protein BT67DRAFT_189389 [Trichocladium antarcticum]